LPFAAATPLPFRHAFFDPMFHCRRLRCFDAIFIISRALRDMAHCDAPLMIFLRPFDACDAAFAAADARMPLPIFAAAIAAATFSPLRHYAIMPRLFSRHCHYYALFSLPLIISAACEQRSCACCAGHELCRRTRSQQQDCADIDAAAIFRR
jgi:hypothetical protein